MDLSMIGLDGSMIDMDGLMIVINEWMDQKMDD
jgi:hypothetical protein